MKNVTDRLDRAPQLWAATKFPREFGVLNTTAVKADVQVQALNWGHLDDVGAPGPQCRWRAEKGSPHLFTVKRPNGNRPQVKAGPAADGH
jgi:hypothetical protein